MDIALDKMWQHWFSGWHCSNKQQIMLTKIEGVDLPTPQLLCFNNDIYVLPYRSVLNYRFWYEKTAGLIGCLCAFISNTNNFSYNNRSVCSCANPLIHFVRQRQILILKCIDLIILYSSHIVLYTSNHLSPSCFLNTSPNWSLTHPMEPV